MNQADENLRRAMGEPLPESRIATERATVAACTADYETRDRTGAAALQHGLLAASATTGQHRTRH
ncbi:hypothetical protein ACIQXD_05025 [Streptomyces uncialis]|uniref:hypothetical protein n=1 Tax=Streptomyces uncialis TaxID=1048205 RepID=UPI00380CA7EA